MDAGGREVEGGGWGRRVAWGAAGTPKGEGGLEKRPPSNGWGLNTVCHAVLVSICADLCAGRYKDIAEVKAAWKLVLKVNYPPPDKPRAKSKSSASTADASSKLDAD